MKKIRINLHSYVNLITNSSTEIYTYQSSSVEPLKELVNEMLNIFDSDKTFDDIFIAGVFSNYRDIAYEIDNRRELKELIPQELLELLESSATKFSEEIVNLKNKILRGEISKPEWMIFYDNNEDDYNEYGQENFLEIAVKNEKYQDLATKLLSFLNSSDHNACYNG